MHAEDIDAFFPKSDKVTSGDQKEETTKSKPSKRKTPDDQEDEKEQIRKQCKYYCGSPAEWNIVRKYKFERQKEYVEEKRFLEEKQLSETVFNATHNCLGVVLDYVTQGEGYVENEIKNDLSLRHAIEEEFQNILYLFNNKIKILFLTSVNVWNGHRIRLRNQPPKPTIVIQEERDEGNDSYQKSNQRHAEVPQAEIS